MTNINIIKRSGNSEPLDIDKIHKVVMWACEGITGVSPSQIEISAQLNFFDGMKSSEIQETLIHAAKNLINEETPNYDKVAGQLVNFHLRKNVYGQYEPKSLYSMVTKNVELGFYDEDLLKVYSEDEFIQMDSFIRHDRDNQLTYAQIEQIRAKYLVKSRVSGEIFETPQLAYMLISASLFQNEEYDIRMKLVRDYYDCISQHEISLPTPIMAAMRTPQKQYASCVLIESDDSLDSINATSNAIVNYVSRKAGIGINAGRIRAKGSPIRKGDTYHTGIFSFIKLFEAATKSCSQGSIRDGSATIFFPLWHLEIENILVLKNNKGTQDNRAMNMDYGIQLNKLMYQRLIKGGDITLFSPDDVPGLYDRFFDDREEFERLYIHYENNPKIRKKIVKASELFELLLIERFSTGRIYIMNVDNCNVQGPFVEKEAPVRQSNLCLEILLPTSPMSLKHNDGEIATCVLSAINWGKIKEPKDFERPCKLAVRALDNLITMQEYPVIEAEISTLCRRFLGIGIINFAYWMAKNGIKYTDPDLSKIDEYAEAWAYYLTKASIDLAKERGHCEWFEDTKYSKGILPIDTRNKNVDNLISHCERMDWDGLRHDLGIHGIRNSTLMALMPSETSSVCANATNGVEPPRSLVTYKQSKDGVIPMVIPEHRRLKNKYELLWDQKSPEGYLKIMAVLQKYVDQAISVNTSYDKRHYGGSIPMSVLAKDILTHYKYGGKTLYYNNQNDGSGDVEDDDCESCKI